MEAEVDEEADLKQMQSERRRGRRRGRGEFHPGRAAAAGARDPPARTAFGRAQPRLPSFSGLGRDGDQDRYACADKGDIGGPPSVPPFDKFDGLPWWLLPVPTTACGRARTVAPSSVTKGCASPSTPGEIRSMS